jgi:hypothetical protein
MKKILLASLLSILFQFSSFSQNEWAPIGAKWYYHTVSLGVDGLLVITSIKDTIILDQNCKKLKFENINVTMNPDGEYYLDTLNYYNYFYYDQDKVYHYDPFGYFYQLYDFSISEGDTVLVRDSSFEGDFSYNRFEYVVDSVKSIDTENITLSAFYTSPSREADWCFSTFADPLPIIEKIGSTQKFLGTYKIIAVSNSSCLNCYVDQEINYRSENLNDTTKCDFIDLSLVGISENYSGLKITPNPFQEHIRLESPFSSIQQIQILDFQGRIRYQANNMEGQLTLRLNFLERGIYIIRLISDERILNRSIIKI